MVGGHSDTKDTRRGWVAGPDTLAVVFLAAASAIIAAPVLTGGVRFYMDHPVHLAEVTSIARGLAGHGAPGWCDDAFCGYPLATVQSPLWYGLLGLLARFGIDPLAPYTMLVWLGFAAPALALYRVARRALSPLMAGALSFLLLIQHPAIAGFESALAGMWTWHLGLAGLILLAGELSEPRPGRRGIARVAALVGVVGLTHLMALAAAAILFAGDSVLRAANRRWPDGRTIAGGLLGLAASSACWLTFVLGAEGWSGLRQDHSVGSLARFLVLPVEPVRHVMERGLYYTDAVPLIAVVLLGVAGGFVLIARRGRRARGDAVAARGVMLALFTEVLLAVAPLLPVPILGPLSWRYVFVIRIGLALAALPAVAALEARLHPDRAWRIALIAAALGSCLWWRLPLRDRVPSPPMADIADVDATWRWLREHPGRGRVAVQDTFFPGAPDPLAWSHVMALTGARTGVPIVGAWYGGVPFPTFEWTRSEFGAVLGISARQLDDRKVARELLRRMRDANARRLVMCDAESARNAARHPEFTIVQRIGRLTVLDAPDLPTPWVSPLTPGVSVTSRQYAGGRIRFEAESGSPGGKLLAHVAWHRFWKLSGPTGARIAPTANGLIEIDGLATGRADYALAWRLPRAPFVLSVLGIGVILALWVRRRDEPADASR